MKYVLIAALTVGINHCVYPQIIEDFNDGDFSDGAPLTWSASQNSGSDDFNVVAGEVQSNGPAASSSLYFSTELDLDYSANDVTWTFKARYTGGAPSGSNRIRIYLLSNVAELTASPQGYYIGMGESGSGDGIDFFKTGTSTPLIEDAGDLVGTGINVHVRITRTGGGTWTLEADPTGGDSFETIGSVDDSEFGTGDFFGFHVRHTSSRFDDFFFDDVTISVTPIPDTTPPTVDSVAVLSSTQMEVYFSEPVDKSSGEDFSNYVISDGVVVSQALQSVTDARVVILTHSELVNGTTYTIEVSNVEDESGNALASLASLDFTYLVLGEAAYGDVVINEFNASPNNENGIPDAEFIELWNVSDKYLQLDGWSFSDAVDTSGLFSPFLLEPNSFVLLTATGNASLFASYGEVMEVTGFRGLNNSGDEIGLLDTSLRPVFSIEYTSSEPGKSSELVNPDAPCLSSSSYDFSTDPAGGTPGRINSVFDDSPDIDPPVVVEFYLRDSLILTFSEMMDVSSLPAGSYDVEGLSIKSVSSEPQHPTYVTLTFSESLVSGKPYELTISNVQDCSGNELQETSISFGVARTPLVGEVVITEIMFDPSPSIDLPEHEYIEILNNTPDLIALEEIELADGQSSCHLPVQTLAPNTYYILTSTSGAEEFPHHAVGVPDFPSLSNRGEVLTLSTNGEMISSIEYRPEWHDQKRLDGGFSLEIKNPISDCPGTANWGSSQHVSGGTPGGQNSIFDDAPDTISPVIISFDLQSDSLKIYFSEPMDELSIISGNYEMEGLSLDTILLAEDFPTSAILIFTEAPTKGAIYQLVVSDVADCMGNLLEATTLFFGSPRTPIFAELAITEIMFDPTPPVDLPEREYIEVFNTTSELLSLQGLTLSDKSARVALPEVTLLPESYYILTSPAGALEFDDNAIGVPNFPSLSNEGEEIVLAFDEETIAAVKYDPIWHDPNRSAGGYSLEIRSPASPCPGIANWGSSQDSSGGTPGRENSIFDESGNEIVPFITSTSYNADTLTIQFLEAMNAASIDSRRYLVEGLTVDGVIAGGEYPTSVSLTFGEPLQPGVIYTLQVPRLSDCSGNMMNPTSIEFGVPRSPSFNELVITEIMFDPDPSQGLISREYIELYNTTDEILTLQGVVLQDANSIVDLPNVILSPHTYYALISTAGSNVEFPNQIGVKGFPSLNNEGESLSLSIKGSLIFAVDYDASWHDSAKVDDGYSLEMKDISNPCAGSVNWGSSESPSGGTPGAANSLQESIPDSFGPEVVNAIAISADTIRIDFSERIDPLPIVEASVTFNPKKEIRSVFFDLQRTNSAFVVLAEELPVSTLISVSVAGIYDCSGNEVQDNETKIAVPRKAELGEILLSEVLFNPRSDGVDFVEIYNSSDDYLRLKNWQLARITKDGVDDKTTLQSDELSLAPKSFLAVTTDKMRLINEYPKGELDNLLQVNSLPTYANDTGNVVLINEASIVHDLFHYRDDYHYNLLESTDGVSLERISFSAPTNDPDNWRSAASSVGYATPGYQNSQVLGSVAVTGQLTIEPKVFIPGNSGTGRDFTTINYQFNEPGKFGNIIIYNQSGIPVKTLAEGALLETSGFLRWDGTTNSGSAARLGYYIILFQVYDNSGTSMTMRETVVVGRDFSRD